MKKFLGISTGILAILFLVSFLSPPAVQALPVWGTSALGELTGSRTSPESEGIDATSLWDNGGLVVSWDISFSSGLWTYDYTLKSGYKDISHFLLEVSTGDFLIADGSSDSIKGPKTWEVGASGEPGLPNDIYGIKFDFGGDPVTYTIVTDRSPVYGVFYAKDGKNQEDEGKVDVVAWSNALNYENYKTNGDLGTIDFIVRPNGPPDPVPEPATMLLLGTGLVGLAGVSRKKILGKR